MRFIRSFFMALRMYSKIPAPRVAWDEKNMAYAMCFFPAVGAFIALFWLVWLSLAKLLGFGTLLTAAVASLIPLFVSGGIHMDGFLDASDALFSRAPRERMLEIMKDPHMGAGAAVALASYTLVAFALWTEVDAQNPAFLAVLLTPMLSRALSALAVVTFKSARGEGLLATFQRAADVKIARAAAIVWILALLGAMVYRAPLGGGAVALAALAVFLAYRLMSYRRFGGTTGDVAGWFVQVCELACLAAYALAAGIGGML